MQRPITPREGDDCTSAAEAVSRLTEALATLGAPDDDEAHELGISERTRAIESHIRAVRRFLNQLF